MTSSPGLIRSVRRSADLYGLQVKLLEFSWFTPSSETFVELIFFRSMPTCIKINIKLTNANKIVMLSQTHGYDQFVRFPKTVKSINIAGSFNDLKTVTGSRPKDERSKSVTNV